ncbi:aldehyde dehydrogenase family protein [Nocardioides KLBMP 9356]|uniref:Aldehyde dehydrogenase family protein n=1 Tax=Nocardioides potassii TaxID=2911371 RepID=A0ABS9HC50_9ACTN|nr:aldehyde dehydrogenase family protein [Nocardioides potassii]MCF6377851.1 aldehyde dehydrogenase family protein [Nocardioides potassii]
MSKRLRSAAVLPVDGVEQPTAEQRTFTAVEPATGEPLWEVPDAGPEDAATAATAARRALLETPWSTDLRLRSDALHAFQEALRDRADDLALLVATETGVPVSLRAEHLDAPIAQVRVEDRDQRAAATVVITPATSPLAVAIEEVGRVLVAGGTVVLKPAVEASSAALEIGRIALDVLPRGVLNVVTTRDVDVAIALTQDPRIDAVSFTGSSVSGERVTVAASRAGKAARIDVGGPGTAQATDDDLEEVVRSAVDAVGANAGQGCRLPSTVLVPPHRYDDALALAVEAMRSVQVGDPTDPVTQCGPLRSRVARDRVLRYLALAGTEGGTIALGGHPLDRPGWWVAPTVIRGLSPQSRLVREEVLGPVLMVVADESSARA